VLQLDLGDHRQHPVALMVQQADEPQLFDQLLAEAQRRFDRRAGEQEAGMGGVAGAREELQMSTALACCLWPLLLSAGKLLS